jgi:hypothetical protein
MANNGEKYAKISIRAKNFIVEDYLPDIIAKTLSQNL